MSKLTYHNLIIQMLRWILSLMWILVSTNQSTSVEVDEDDEERVQDLLEQASQWTYPDYK